MIPHELYQLVIVFLRGDKYYWKKQYDMILQEMNPSKNPYLGIIRYQDEEPMVWLKSKTKLSTKEYKTQKLLCRAITHIL